MVFYSKINVNFNPTSPNKFIRIISEIDKIIPKQSTKKYKEKNENMNRGNVFRDQTSPIINGARI